MFMTVMLLSLAGFPPTAGFVGKLYIFKSAVQAGLYLARHYRCYKYRNIGVLLSARRRNDVYA